jgi:type IV pilus assembly protein PilQ
MSSHGKWFLAALAAAALAGSLHLAASDGPPSAGDAAALVPTDGQAAPVSELRAMRVVPGTTGTEIAIEGTGPLRYDAQTIDNPRRLVLDLEGVVSRLRSNQVPVGSGGVVRVRGGQFKTSPRPVSRVVFDLEGDVTYEIRESDRGLTVAFSQAGGVETAAAPAQPPAPASPPAAIVAEEPEPSPIAEAVAATVPPEAAPVPSRALAPEALEKLLRAPALAAQSDEQPMRQPASPSQFASRTISSNETQYTGRRISLNMVDADVKEIFRLFHEISGLNFVLDPGVSGKVTIVLDQVPWDQALDIILTNNGFDKVLENNVIRIASTQKLAAEAAARKSLKEAKELEVEPITVTRTLSYAKAKDVERVIRDGGILSARGKVIVDERTNALIVSDIPKRIEPLNQLLDTLDSETPQVMIEARIVETSREFSQDVGIKWGFNAIADASRGTSTRLNFPRNASAKYALNLPGTGGANTLQFKIGNILDSFTLDLALTAIEIEGRGRILSSPKIATQNNERAEIEQGVRIPVVNTTATEINVEFVSASLRLAVTPQITAEGTVIMDVTVENNQPDFLNRVGDVPPITTQRAQTKILVSDGGTAVIGGIFTVNEGVSEQGVPWFRKIPGLGWLFKQKTITNNNRELLIFLTPKILKVG